VRALRSGSLILPLLVAIPMVFNGVELLPELTTIPNVNDDAAHLLFVRRADDAITFGQDPVDFWVPDLELGFPEFVYYQHLPHLTVVALYRALLRTVDLATVFNGVRYLLMVGLPLTVFWSMRRMGFGGLAAAVGAAASSLLSSGSRLGFDYDSYIWRGYGVFTQLVAMHLLFLALATLHRLLERGKGYLTAALTLSALVLSHLLYAYMMAISAAVLVVAAAPRVMLLRLLRLTAVGIIAVLVGAYLIVPDLIQAPFQAISPFLERYKYDSFGAGPILGWLLSGELFDAGRPPVLTALVGVGIVGAIATRSRPALLALGLFALWLVLYFGRPTLGGIVDLFPMHQALFFHRFIGGVHLAGILLIGVGAAWLWQLASRFRRSARLAAAAVGLAILFLPTLAERDADYRQNAAWMAETRSAIDRDADARAVFETLAALPPGRVYAGQKRDWSEQLDFGIPFTSVRLYNLFADRRIASFAPPYQGGSLNSDLLFDFDPLNKAHYAVFGVTYLIAPSTRQLPDFLVPLRRTPLYTLYAAPASAAARYAAVADAVAVATQPELQSVMRGWLLGPLPAEGKVLQIEYPARTVGAPVRRGAACDRGTVTAERIEPGAIAFIASCPTAATLVLPITYHPNWQVTSDGEAVATFMASPSVVAVSLPPGRHAISATYRSTPIKAPLLGLAALAAGGAVLGRRRLERLDAALASRLARR
jgi:hypothetical protein